jgi:hypothetical protein
VGNATLTEKDLAGVRSAQAEHLALQYVSNWVTSELLYQEARRNGFAESDEVLRQIEQAKKQLTINAYLEKEIFSGDSAEVDEAALEQEFKSNRQAYRLREDVVKISFAIFDERDAANTFRSKVLRGTTWIDAVREIESDPEAKKQLLRVATNEYFTQAMLYPEELWKIARTLSKEDVSYVVKTDAGYCVVLVHGTQRQGEPPDFNYAKSEMKERLTIERRKAKYDELLATLRSKYDVDVRLGSTDSTLRNANE